MQPNGKGREGKGRDPGCPQEAALRLLFSIARLVILKSHGQRVGHWNGTTEERPRGRVCLRLFVAVAAVTRDA